MNRTFKLYDWLKHAPKAMRYSAVLLVIFFLMPVAASQAETRKLKLYFLHTGEKAEIAYKKNGRYLPAGLKKINRFLRDWRRNEPTKMDPQLLDLIWEVYQETGSRKHIHVISGYRSPKTNSLLRKRGRGVAKKSQHTLGKALDFFIPGVKLSKLRAIGLRKGLGGVGYYPRSGSPFVHMDTGRVRHWPRMSRKELVSVFPKGRTLHVPTDGKPLPGYDQAKIEYERRKSGKSVIASAEQIRKKPNILNKLYNRRNEDEGVQAATTARKPVQQTPKVPQPVTPTPAPATVPTSSDPVLATDVPIPQNVIPSTNPNASAPTPQAPIPGINEPAIVEENPIISESPETIIAAIAPEQLPVPEFSPRTLLLATNAQENSGTQEIEADTISDDDIVEIATAIPVPTRSPNLISNIVIAENVVEAETISQPEQEAETPLQPALEVAALSPSEIEDLRNEVYEGVIDNPTTQSGDITLLTALSSSNTADTKTKLSASEAITAQLVGIGADTKPADKVEPSSGITSQAVAAEPVILANSNIPIPVRNPLAAENKITAAKVVLEANDSDQPSSIEERMIGQWAFATKQSIQTISKINPIEKNQNIFGNFPSSIESTGFSILNENTDFDSFSFSGPSYGQ